MWLLTEENELVNLTVFVAIRLEPSEEDDNLFSLVGVLSAAEETDTDEESEDGDEAFVQLSPPLSKGAATALFRRVIEKLDPVRVKQDPPTPVRPPDNRPSNGPRRGPIKR